MQPSTECKTQRETTIWLVIKKQQFRLKMDKKKFQHNVISKKFKMLRKSGGSSTIKQTLIAKDMESSTWMGAFMPYLRQLRQKMLPVHSGTMWIPMLLQLSNKDFGLNQGLELTLLMLSRGLIQKQEKWSLQHIFSQSMSKIFWTQLATLSTLPI